MKLSRNILVVEVLHDSLYDESGVPHPYNFEKTS